MVLSGGSSRFDAGGGERQTIAGGGDAAAAGDACGAGHPEAAQRSLENLKFMGDTIVTSTDEIFRLLSR